VSVGSGVSQGQQIAESGSPGNTTGDDLHFGIRGEGSWVDLPNLLP
jgi:murein DD-endopeptidase MepM/ murein hydrolase activator NlpD